MSCHVCVYVCVCVCVCVCVYAHETFNLHLIISRKASTCCSVVTSSFVFGVLFDG